MHVERLHRAEPVLVPDVGHQVLATHDASGFPHEPGEQVELLERQRDRRPVEARAPAALVDLEVTDPHGAARPVCGTGGSPQDGAHPREELCAAEGFDDVVVGAELESDDLVELGAPAVSMISGTRESRLISRQTSRPSPSGSVRSRITNSNSCRRAACRAPATVLTTVGTKPSRRSAWARGSATEASSSTSRTCIAWARSATTVSSPRNPTAPAGRICRFCPLL